MTRVHAKPYDRIKRGLDIVAATLGLVISSPVQIVVALAVSQRLGRPVLFRQDRPGLDGEIFTLIKFRTMLDVDPLKGLVTDEQRLTPFGRRLRSTSLDELPTLFNVLKGDMSIVGPRPLLVRYLDRYSPLELKRHDVRPGMTGLAQVNGRNALGWSQKFAFDIEYAEKRSFLLDAWISMRTVRLVLRREGIASERHVTMSEFTGTSNDD